MPTVQIEHAVPDFGAWKAAFDRDPAGRAASGVRRYRIYRPLGDEHYAIVELDFDDVPAAEAFVARMRAIWRQVEGDVMTGPQVRVVACIEDRAP